jgi:dienelactone hydrolase
MYPLVTRDVVATPTRRGHAAVAPDVLAIPAGAVMMHGELRLPSAAPGLVLFAQVHAYSPWSCRNRDVVEALERSGFAMLLLNLLTRDEDAVDRRTAEYRFDVQRLGERLIAAIDWAAGHADLRDMPLCCFGGGTGAAAALIAAAERPQRVHAVISRGGRPDLAGDALERVRQPTLLIVGGLDRLRLDANREAAARLRAPTDLEIVAGSRRLDVPATLGIVCYLARSWCAQHLVGRGAH